MAGHHLFVGFKKPFHLLLQLQTLKMPKLDISISVPHKTTEIQPKLPSMFAKQTKLPKQYREGPGKYKIDGKLKVKSVMILKHVIKNYFYDFLTKIFCGYGSFEHPKQRLKMMATFVAFQTFWIHTWLIKNTRPDQDPICLTL